TDGLPVTDQVGVAGSSGFLGGQIWYPLNISELETLNNNVTAMTATTGTGAPANGNNMYTCLDWTTTSSADQWTGGLTVWGGGAGDWTNSSGTTCNAMGALYCFGIDFANAA